MRRKIKQIATSESHGPESCHNTILALCEDGTLWCWRHDCDKWEEWDPLPNDDRPEPPPIYPTTCAATHMDRFGGTGQRCALSAGHAGPHAAGSHRWES